MHGDETFVAERPRTSRSRRHKNADVLYQQEEAAIVERPQTSRGRRQENLELYHQDLNTSPSREGQQEHIEVALPARPRSMRPRTGYKNRRAVVAAASAESETSPDLNPTRTVEDDYTMHTQESWPHSTDELQESQHSTYHHRTSPHHTTLQVHTAPQGLVREKTQFGDEMSHRSHANFIERVEVEEDTCEHERFDTEILKSGQDNQELYDKSHNTTRGKPKGEDMASYIKHVKDYTSPSPHEIIRDSSGHILRKSPSSRVSRRGTLPQAEDVGMDPIQNLPASRPTSASIFSRFSVLPQIGQPTTIPTHVPQYEDSYASYYHSRDEVLSHDNDELYPQSYYQSHHKSFNQKQLDGNDHGDRWQYQPEEEFYRHETEEQGDNYSQDIHDYLSEHEGQNYDKWQGHDSEAMYPTGEELSDEEDTPGFHPEEIPQFSNSMKLSSEDMYETQTPPAEADEHTSYQMYADNSEQRQTEKSLNSQDSFDDLQRNASMKRHMSQYDGHGAYSASREDSLISFSRSTSSMSVASGDTIVDFPPLDRLVTLPPEPKDSEERIRLGIKLPNGRRIQRNFRTTNTWRVVLQFAENEAQLDFSGCFLVYHEGSRKAIENLAQRILDTDVKNKTVLHIEIPD